MNLQTITRNKLQTNIYRRDDLKECLEEILTEDAIQYCRDELNKAETNIEYYTKILEVLEGR